MDLNYVLQKVRRRINDIEEPYVYEDSYIKNLIIDSVDSLYSLWPIDGFSLQVVDDEFNQEIDNNTANCIALEAHIIHKKILKTTADEENFKMKKGSLQLDNTNQTKDHGETIAMLEAERDRILDGIYDTWRRSSFVRVKGMVVR